MRSFTSPVRRARRRGSPNASRWAVPSRRSQIDGPRQHATEIGRSRSPCAVAGACSVILRNSRAPPRSAVPRFPLGHAHASRRELPRPPRFPSGRRRTELLADRGHRGAGRYSTLRLAELASRTRRARPRRHRTTAPSCASDDATPLPCAGESHVSDEAQREARRATSSNAAANRGQRRAGAQGARAACLQAARVRLAVLELATARRAESRNVRHGHPGARGVGLDQFARASLVRERRSNSFAHVATPRLSQLRDAAAGRAPPRASARAGSGSGPPRAAL